jgi:hypothetical protein
MAIIFVIIGAAAGGVLGWLLDRNALKHQAEAQDTCAPTSG